VHKMEGERPETTRIPPLRLNRLQQYLKHPSRRRVSSRENKPKENSCATLGLALKKGYNQGSSNHGKRSNSTGVLGSMIGVGTSWGSGRRERCPGSTSSR